MATNSRKKTRKQALGAQKLKKATNSVASLLKEFQSRRPHRSFRRTRKRDYTRSLDLPGYISFNILVLDVVRKNKLLFLKLAGFYAVLSILFIGLASQSSYAELSALLDEEDWSALSGGWAALSQGSALLFLGLSGGANAQLTDIQQIYAVIIFLLTWLTTVWLLRAVLAGQRPRFRDGLYNAGGPIVSTGIMVFILFVQLLPAILGILLYSAASSTELLQNSLTSMLAGLVVALLSLLSLYWAVATFVALVIVTLPNMYPWQAIRAAGDIVTGRRLRLLLRILWMFLGNTVALIVIVLPFVLFDRWIKSLMPMLEPVPLIPVAVSILSSCIVVWSAAYIYILYRKVVEDDSNPA